ncbi:phosphatase [Lonsdalea iberica]|uniref:Phosphatase n=1 Tax=Lonsdalea iberica TaxID=1082703 RepID=A0ABX3XFP4_9GAMM|nr:sugar phosphatase [Lonsdalea iberica]OSN09872.1 phosphatase [Lonsdalea iberica]
MEVKGFLFDLDGTLVNSLPVVENAWRWWAEGHGLDSQAVLDFIHGKQAITSLRHFLHDKSEAEIQHAYQVLEERESTDLEGITAMPGAQALLEHLEALNVPWAIVTSGSVPIAHARHKAAGLLMPRQFVTAERVANGKPHPDAYLLGAQLLGLDPQACAVVEDAPAGIQSGLAAKAKVIAVNAPSDAPDLDKVDMVLHSLEQLEVTPSGAAFVVTASR